MSGESQKIDWAAARRQLKDAEIFLEKALTADAKKIEEVYRQRAVQIAKRHMERAASAQTITVLVFCLSTETYGLPITDVAEVLPPTKCTPVPSCRSRNRWRHQSAWGTPVGNQSAPLVIPAAGH